MAQEFVAHPPIVSREEWLALRREHLIKEKNLTRAADRLRAERRRLPMVKLDKSYEFDGPEGKVSLMGLFEGNRQLIIQHFMFGPDWEKGCPGCTGHVDQLGDLSELANKSTRYVIIARAPLPKLQAYWAVRGWDWPVYSSFNSDFNYDFQVTLDKEKGLKTYNYKEWDDLDGEMPGFSVFFQMHGDIYHTYSTFQRGTEALADSYGLLDITPYGRQQDFEDSPEGWPQRPTYG